MKTSVRKGNKEHHENPVVERHEKRVAMGKKYMQALQMKRDVQGMIRINYDNTPVGKKEGKEYELGKMKALG